MPSCRPWLALLLVSGPLLAEDPGPEPPTRFGIQVTTAVPRGDFRDITHKQGLGGGAFFEQDLEGGWSVRARFDYLTYSAVDVRDQKRLPSFLPSTALRMAADQTSIGAEVRYHPQGLGGLFFLGGAFGTRLEFKTVGQAPSTDPGPLDPPDVIVSTKDKTSFKFGLAAGLGFQLSPRLALTVRHTTFTVAGVTLATFEGGVDFRF
jgi:opacity protein-like surface antigen